MLNRGRAETLVARVALSMPKLRSGYYTIAMIYQYLIFFADLACLMLRFAAVIK